MGRCDGPDFIEVTRQHFWPAQKGENNPRIPSIVVQYFIVCFPTPRQ
jgi:hypothetical protein